MNKESDRKRENFCLKGILRGGGREIAENERTEETDNPFGRLLNPIKIGSGSISNQQDTVDPLGEHGEIEFAIGGRGSRYNPLELNAAPPPGQLLIPEKVPEVEVVIKDGVVYPIPRTPSGSRSFDIEDDSESEWEETYLYLDLDDIPNIQELFAVNPDDFMFTYSNKRMRDKQPKIRKPTHPKITFKFHNFDTNKPVLQIGHRFYQGTFEEPFGTSLFFRQKPETKENPKSKPSTSKTQTPTSDKSKEKFKLQKLTSDLNPPPDAVFGAHLQPEFDEYELVAKSHKFVRMTRRNLKTSKSTGMKYQTPSGLPVKSPRLPRGFVRKTPMAAADFTQVSIGNIFSGQDSDSASGLDQGEFIFKKPIAPALPSRKSKLTMGSGGQNLDIEEMTNQTEELIVS